MGYGDIVPETKGGKLFATIYILVAGTILLNNMSLISMIPLELRKRRIERAVLTQVGIFQLTILVGTLRNFIALTQHRSFYSSATFLMTMPCGSWHQGP